MGEVAFERSQGDTAKARLKYLLKGYVSGQGQIRS